MATAARATLRAHACACALLCALLPTLATGLPTTTHRAETEQTTERILRNSIETLTEDDAGSAGAGAGACPSVVGRAGWGAAPPRQVERQEGPALLAIVHHTYIPGACNSSAACEAAMRAMQRYHQEERGWNDIGYNFVVGGDGRVYEGRGWGVVGAHALRYNLRSVGVSLIGDYVASAPPAHMTALAQRLLACGVRRGALAADYRLLGHRQVRDTQCPGDAFYAQLSAWPHWVARLDPTLDAAVRSNATATATATTTSTTTTPSPS